MANYFKATTHNAFFTNSRNSLGGPIKKLEDDMTSNSCKISPEQYILRGLIFGTPNTYNVYSTKIKKMKKETC